jgi:hypothetical protein
VPSGNDAGGSLSRRVPLIPPAPCGGTSARTTVQRTLIEFLERDKFPVYKILYHGFGRMSIGSGKKSEKKVKFLQPRVLDKVKEVWYTISIY